MNINPSGLTYKKETEFSLSLVLLLSKVIKIGYFFHNEADKYFLFTQSICQQHFVLIASSLIFSITSMLTPMNHHGNYILAV